MKYDLILNDIVGYWPVTGRNVRSFLSSRKGKPVTVFISSPGGSLQDGLLIRQAFLDHGDVTAYIHGFTASAATIMSLGAKTVVMADSAFYMVHCASLDVWNYGSMNAEEIQRTIQQMEGDKEFLEKTDGVMAYLYAKKCGKKPEDCFAMMKKETWLTAQEAKEIGLADEVADDPDVPAAQLSASMQARLTACGLPLPPMANRPSTATAAVSEPSAEEAKSESSAQDPAEDTPSASPSNEESSPSMLDAVMNGLRSFFGTSKNIQENNSPIENVIMDKKTLPLILAVLALEQITASADGNIAMTNEQLSSLEAHMKKLTDKVAALEKENTTLEGEKKDLQAKVEALGKEDGASTQSAGLSDDAPAMSVQERYNALAGIL